MSQSKEITKTPKYKQPNTFSQAFYKTSTLGQKLFCYTIYKFTKDEIENSTPRKVSFTVSDFCNDLNFSKSGQNYESLKAAVSDIYDLSIQLEDDDEKQKFKKLHIFSECEINGSVVSFRFEEKTKTLIRKFQEKRFTLLSLAKIGQLKSFYAIRYYEIALSWSGKKNQVPGKPGYWFFDYTVEELKQLFQIEEMRNNNFMARVVKGPLEEINQKIDDLEITYEVREKKGKTPTKLRFWCKEKKNENFENKELISLKSIREPENNEKTVSKMDEKTVNLLKKHYSDIYNELVEKYKEEKGNNNWIFSPELMAEQELWEKFQAGELD